MDEPAFDSVNLQDCIARWQAGDRRAADDLLRATSARLEKLARRMIRSFPNVRGQADTGDVLQNSLIRLLRTLRTLRPKTTRDFFNLAAVHIRRELLDLSARNRLITTAPASSPGKKIEIVDERSEKADWTSSLIVSSRSSRCATDPR